MRPRTRTLLAIAIAWILIGLLIQSARWWAGGTADWFLAGVIACTACMVLLQVWLVVPPAPTGFVEDAGPTKWPDVDLMDWKS